MKNAVKSIIVTILCCIGYFSFSQEVLPFPPTPSASVAGLTIQTSTHQKRLTPSRLPKDAPNILIILIDDVGPGVASTYGGEVNTPTLNYLKNYGMKTPLRGRKNLK